MSERFDEHRCPECLETCFCNGGATDVFACTHLCEWAPQEDDDAEQRQEATELDDYLQYLSNRDVVRE